MFKPISLITASCLLLSTSYVLGESDKHWQQRAYIHDSFAQIALQSEHNISDGLLHKWQQPLFYTVIDRTGDQYLHHKMVAQHFKHLSLITGHEIAPANKQQAANVRIIFNSEENLDDDLMQSLGVPNQRARYILNRNSVCVAQFSYDSSASINKAVIIIPVDRARAHGKLMACVVEELTQIMGLPNDSASVYPSIFNDYSFNDFLTGLDYLLLKLLYNTSLKAGMSSKQIRKVVSEITQSQEYSDLIGKAEVLVRKKSLENWLD